MCCKFFEIIYKLVFFGKKEKNSELSSRFASTVRGIFKGPSSTRFYKNETIYRLNYL